MQEIALMHAHMAKLLELGVDEEWLSRSNLSPDEARELLKGILYLKEMHPQFYEHVNDSRRYLNDLR